MILHICVSLFFISLFSNVTHPSSLIISVTLAMSRLDKRRERVVVEIKMEELVELEMESEKTKEQKDEAKKLVEGEKKKAIEMRERAMERFSQTEKRQEETKG